MTLTDGRVRTDTLVIVEVVDLKYFGHTSSLCS